MIKQTDQFERDRSLLQRCSTAFRMLLATTVVAGSMVVTAPIDDADAAAGDRALKLHNAHTQETATIVFKRNGRYDPAGLKQLNVFLRDWRKNEPTKMDPQLFDLIWEVYQQAGSRVPITVICGYRSPATNGMLRSRSRGVAKQSQHMLGKAMDFYMPDVPLAKLRAIGLKMQVGGVGFYPTSGSPFVHMDTGSVRHWPKMTREQLVRIFPNGKTLHVPSDGRPLPGYEQALAAYKARKAGGGSVMMASASSSKGKSWFSRLTGNDSADEDDIPAVAAPAAKPGKAPAAMEADADAVQVAAVAKTDEPAAEEAVPFATASAPLPRPAPNREAEAVVVAAADTEAVGAFPPAPRRSPVARPIMAMASVAPIPQASPVQPAPAYGSGITDTLAALEATSSARANAQVAGLRKSGTAADAIAEAVGKGKPSSDAMMAYAAPLTFDETAAPHIDAATGAIVAGHAAKTVAKASATGGAKLASRGNASGLQAAAPVVANDPLARLTPVAYEAATIELVTRTGSTRQKPYANLQMPTPFLMPELFTAPERSIRLGFGRIAYEGLRTDRFAGPLVHHLGTQEFAQLETIGRTAFLKR
ncbi:uncharacterized protein YcbK (DUF882 family) [Kaistia defluvii]|uniref:Murein endopeptidase K n=2 Tax=Kaistia defluvii TaxID=410841 RepID=A0ABV2R1K0_9HYPH